MQLQRVGTRLLGAVVVPRLSPEDLPVRHGSHHPAGSEGKPSYDTEGWIGSPPPSFDGPTSKLDTLGDRPAPSPHDADNPAPSSAAGPA